MTEEWREIPGYDGDYKISSKGRKMSFKRNASGRISIHNSKKGYPLVCLSDKKSVKHTLLLHRVVWEVFKGSIPRGMEINHKDGNKNNPSLSNLELVTRRENCIHAFEMGLRKPTRRKLKDLEVIKIKKLLKKRNISQNKISLIFKCNPLTISRINNRISYKDIIC